MNKVRQVVVRNIPEKGLDVVATDLQKSQIQNISIYLPEEEPAKFNEVFLTKFYHSSGNVVLRFTFNDGVDNFGRQSIKTHSLIIENSFYNEKTLQYFISPLINGSMNVENNRILKQNDFETLDIHPISSKITEFAFCKKQIQLTSQKEMNSLGLIQLFGTIDRVIPPPLNPFFSFQTMVSPGYKKGFKKYNLLYSYDKLSHSRKIEQIQMEKSEFPTIQAITDSISDLPSLRLLQKQLFLKIPERLLRLRLQWRFGIKTFSNIRENLNNYFV
ncbi:MAG: hypothetical protein ACFFFH_18260 [Candidatus Thorarchaeota archaeon]